MISKHSHVLRIVQLFTLLVLFFSCSSKVTKLQRVQPDSYLSPKYEDQSFKNVSMDICYPILDFEILPEGADTAHIMNIKEFDAAFKEYFPDGIKMFSSVTNTGWIFFKPNYNIDIDIIEYHTKTKDGSDFYVYLVDSIAIFQRQSNSDFLMMFQMIYSTKSIADTTIAKNKYATVIGLDYMIWDTMTGDLVAMDKVNSKMEFDRLAGNWPYRGAVLKSAALIFEKLPMF
jgi:hypothetical protein